MTINTILIRIGGLINLLAAILHLAFWQLFDWGKTLSVLSIENSNIMQMLNLFIIVFFTYAGSLLMLYPEKILGSGIGKHFLGMLSLMWMARLGMEFYFPAGDLVFAGILTFTIFCFTYPLAATFQIKSKIDSREHSKHAWRVHALLIDFDIEDVWELPLILNRDQSVVDVQAVFASAIDEIARTGFAGFLFRIRFLLGKVFGWDDKVYQAGQIPTSSIRERYGSMHKREVPSSLSQRGTEFIPVYQFPDESLAEIENDTVHAAVHYGKVHHQDNCYKVQMTVYVKPKGLFGKVYMQIIKPFRLLVVYPIMLKAIGKLWQRRQHRAMEEDMVLA